MTQVVVIAVEDQRAQRLHVALALLRRPMLVLRKIWFSSTVSEAKAAQDLHLSEEWTTPGEEWKERRLDDFPQGLAALERQLNSATPGTFLTDSISSGLRYDSTKPAAQAWSDGVSGDWSLLQRRRPACSDPTDCPTPLRASASWPTAGVPLKSCQSATAW